MKKLKIIISGGGTGGHIFPAIAIANEIKEINPEAEILFVGAKGRMEMERVPAAGYEIVGLPIMGFPRRPGINTLKFFATLAKGMREARGVIRRFCPDVVVGVGGYASGPTLRVAASTKIPTLIQEQNSYAGITNRLLSKKVEQICVAYDQMERYFPAAKIVHTGNPVRKNLIHADQNLSEAREFFKLKTNAKVLLVVGGSLGARTLNNSLLASIAELQNSGIEVIWQTGKFYFESVQEKLKEIDCPNVHVHEFLSRMDLAYAVSDLVISRAGAGTISELCLMGKPTILVPSPNVAEDHQTKNAMALVDKDAAEMIMDVEAEEKLVTRALQLINESVRLQTLASNVKLLAKPNAANDIAKMVIKLANKE